MSEPGTALLRVTLCRQYHAALATLRDAIERCPADLWTAAPFGHPFWRVAYHALFYTHFYLARDEASFAPWERHRKDMNFLHRSVAGEPLSREEILAYWELCDRMVEPAIDAFDLADTTSGFSWYPIPKLEHQLVNIRHIQHHAAQLGERLRAAGAGGLEWVSTAGER